MHVHVQRADDNAKFWLGPPVRLAFNDGFRESEMTEIRKTIGMNRRTIKTKWDEHFGK